MKSFFPAHETARGYEPLAALGGSLEYRRMGGRALVHRGPGNALDSEIMAYAAEHDYVVLTHDMDFSAILAATHGEKPSVVQLRIDDVTPQVAGPPVLEALRHMKSELDAGAVLTVGPRRSRVRLLPLTPKK